MTRVETARQLRWLMSFRIVTLATLLVCAFGIEVLLRPTESLRPLVILAACSFTMVLGYALLDRWMRGHRLFVLMQLVGDALIISFFVQITGGLDSPMSFLYLLPISAGSILLYRGGGVALAAVCWTLYLALAAFGASWAPFGILVPMSAETDAGRTVYLLVAHLVAMLAFALLASSLSERLRSQGHELAERQRAVARLTALNENIIESINSGLVTTDRSGVVNFLNRGGSEIIGFDPGEVDGRPIESLLELGDGFLQEIRNELLAERRFRFERWADTKAGHRIFLGIAVSNLHDKAGSPLGYIFIFQDLTEIHALEQEVRLRERMVALGEMAAGMAHELRNPLASISGAVQYLKGELRPAGETLELMDIILRESQRLDQTIRDFLTFTRPGKFAPEPIDLIRLLEDSLKLLDKSHEMRGDHRLETRFEVPELVCELDANRMKQVFWNLTTNGLKAMPEGGTLSIAAGIDTDGERIKIEFRDEGVGMDPAQQGNYFQPFSSSFKEGTGLGAAIVYRLIEEHAGRIQLESNVGHGTCVTIVLPYRKPAAVQEPPRLRAAGG